MYPLAEKRLPQVIALVREGEQKGSGEVEMNETQTRPAPVFDLTGGSVCLDFTNTLEGRLDETPQELLSNYSDLIAWGRQAQMVTDEEARRLLEEEARRPDDAKATLQRAITLREALYRICEKVVEEAVPEGSDLLILDSVLSQGMAQARILAEGDGFRWGWEAKGEALESVLWVVARSTADLLTSELRHAVRMCGAEDCGWLFLDTSKNHSRRWCSMKSCGNRAKARRYLARNR
jgi:predicted RNA-binding Zn ribbon-like protein